MDETKFESFLADDTSITSKYKAVKTRLSKARSVEKCLKTDLASIVCDDDKMYQALLSINDLMNNRNGVYSNALRKYYVFRNGYEFPMIAEDERIKKIRLF